MVEKGPEAYRTIGEASKEVGEPSYVLRFWETKFNQIKLIKRPGGRRFYRPEDINLLIKIKNFRTSPSTYCQKRIQFTKQFGMNQILKTK